MLSLRPFDHSLIAPAVALEAVCYPSPLLEGTAFFTSMLEHWPDCALAMVDSTRPEVLAAYCLAHPVPRDYLPALCQFKIPGLAELNTAQTDWFIHDVSVHPRYRGSGLPATLLKASLNLPRARLCPRLSLVALAGRESYWARFGFQTDQRQLGPEAGYGPVQAMHCLRQQFYF